MEKTLKTKEYRVLRDRLRLARLEQRVSQETLAERLGETQSFVSLCERGERRLDVVELMAWCQALDVSFAEFMVGFAEAVSHGRSTNGPKRARAKRRTS